MKPTTSGRIDLRSAFVAAAVPWIVFVAADMPKTLLGARTALHFSARGDMRAVGLLLQVLLSVILPFGASSRLGFTWTSPGLGGGFVLAALLLPVFFQVAYRLLSKRTDFRDGLYAGLFLGAWILLSIPVVIEPGSLSNLMYARYDGVPIAYILGLNTGRVFWGMLFVSIWVVAGSSLVAWGLPTALSRSGRDVAPPDQQ